MTNKEFVDKWTAKGFKLIYQSEDIVILSKIKKGE